MYPASGGEREAEFDVAAGDGSEVRAGLESGARRVVRAGVVALLVMAVTSNAMRLDEARRYFTPAVAARIVSMLAPTSVPSTAALR